MYTDGASLKQYIECDATEWNGGVGGIREVRECNSHVLIDCDINESDA
jgi:hypothetical protein